MNNLPLLQGGGYALAAKGLVNLALAAGYSLSSARVHRRSAD
jgi:hypothetical protein